MPNYHINIPKQLIVTYMMKMNKNFLKKPIIRIHIYRYNNSSKYQRKYPTIRKVIQEKYMNFFN